MWVGGGDLKRSPDRLYDHEADTNTDFHQQRCIERILYRELKGESFCVDKRFKKNNSRFSLVGFLNIMRTECVVSLNVPHPYTCRYSYLNRSERPRNGGPGQTWHQHGSSNHRWGPQPRGLSNDHLSADLTSPPWMQINARFPFVKTECFDYWEAAMSFLGLQIKIRRRKSKQCRLGLLLQM